MTCEILVPQAEMETVPPALEAGVPATTGLPGKGQTLYFNCLSQKSLCRRYNQGRYFVAEETEALRG